jgi:hypothetical protein
MFCRDWTWAAVVIDTAVIIGLWELLQLFAKPLLDRTIGRWLDL